MAMPIRVKTIWFKKDGERSVDEIASAVATTTWNVADKAVDNLGGENYDIITPARGFKVSAGPQRCCREAPSGPPRAHARPRGRAARIRRRSGDRDARR